jgi:hypothetical protein
MADNIKIEWKGDKYADRLQRNVQQAIEHSAEMVRTKTMKALNVGGQKGKGLAKLNKIAGKMSDEARTATKIARGEALMGGSLKNFKSKSGKLNVRFGGSFTHTDKSGATETYDRVYWYGEPVNKWVTASRPGTPPNRQTGDLRRQIQYEFASDGLSAKVGPLDKLEYARRQELGGPGSFPARPYLRPSFLACKPKIIDMIKDAAEKAGKA